MLVESTESFLHRAVATARRSIAALAVAAAIACAMITWLPTATLAATPCDKATHPDQCGWFDAGTLPPFVIDAVLAKQGAIGAGNVLVLTSGDPADPDAEISNDMGQAGCGTNPDGWQTYDCVQLKQYVPAEDSVVLAISSEWFEWYQTIFTDWMTISGAGVATVDVSINSWIDNKVDIIPYGPDETGVVLLTSLSAAKMVDIRVADSGDHIYDTAIVVVPATWFAAVESSDGDPTLLCGNGELDPGEDCDDGNHVTDDDCSSLCRGVQTQPSVSPTPSTCGNLFYEWPNGTTLPYTCGQDLCQGFRCVLGDTISPACYTADQCASACAGGCVDIQVAQLDCSTMCGVQPSATAPAPPAETCATLVYEWPDGTSMPYACDDTCEGQRCVTGSAVSPECFAPGECDASTCPEGVCVDTPATDCAALCDLGQPSDTCLPQEKDTSRVAANQKGACFGNFETCNGSGIWEIANGSWEPREESCNGIDDDCNGVVDDMFVTCGDPGLCENTVNTCDPNNPSVPIVCQPLAPPSPVEICNDGLDNDCDGSADDGCECGDDECMPGEDFENCPADCPAPLNGTPCDDGDLCTEGDTWQFGTCEPGAPVVCGADNACVVGGVCDPATGCSATKVDCGDAIECTVDSCDSVEGCLHVPEDSLCDDGDPCTTDTCDVALGCAHEPDPTCGGLDADEDGYLDAASGGTDCDDSDAAVHPGATETCNSRDDDCNSVVDDGFATGAACESAANACGVTGAGTVVCRVDGTGVECDAGIPSEPAGFGEVCTSVANVCGDTASGTIGCDGACDASTPLATDGDADGVADCVDDCPADATKVTPGACGCGVSDEDTNSNGVADCLETERADLSAHIERRGPTPRVGRRLRYRLTVENAGPSDVAESTVSVAVTGGALSKLKMPRGCTGDAGAITCTTRGVRSGRHRHLTISFVPLTNAEITVATSVSAALVDPDPANQTASTATTFP